MAWYNDGDGWRDESTEGPYIDTLKTQYNGPWEIFRSVRATEPGYRLKNTETGFEVTMPTVAAAKQYVKENPDVRN